MPVVSPDVEKRLLRKLDMRIVPMVMWIYLMNFMDRGKYYLLCCDDAVLLTMGSEHRQRSPLQHGGRPQSRTQSIPALRQHSIRDLLRMLLIARSFLPSMD